MAADVAILEGSSRVRAGHAARYRVTLLHPGGGSPAATLIDFGDGTAHVLTYRAGLSPHVYDAVATHAFSRSGRFAIAIRNAAGHVLASEGVEVSAPPAPRAVPGDAAVSGARSPLIPPGGGASAPDDPTHSGILIAPGPPPIPPADSPADTPAPRAPAGPAGSPISVPSTAPARTLPPRPAVPPGGTEAAPPPTPTPTPRTTTGDR